MASSSAFVCRALAMLLFSPNPTRTALLAPEALTSSSAAAVVPPVAWITRGNFSGAGGFYTRSRRALQIMESLAFLGRGWAKF